MTKFLRETTNRMKEFISLGQFENACDVMDDEVPFAVDRTQIRAYLVGRIPGMLINDYWATKFPLAFDLIVKYVSLDDNTRKRIKESASSDCLSFVVKEIENELGLTVKNAVITGVLFGEDVGINCTSECQRDRILTVLKNYLSPTGETEKILEDQYVNKL
ncbi:MAG: hypothetical protein Q7R33_02900 [Nitrosarchaeum sp.]|nr:hypothetical protein [Nitrosarchaeum sp.]